MKRHPIAAAAALALAASAVLLPSATAGGAARSAGSHTVVLKSLRFHPGTIELKHGESVIWQWQDGHTKHNVTFHSTHSKTISSGSFTVRFNNRGTFEYHCTIHFHQGMKGKIVVR